MKTSAEKPGKAPRKQSSHPTLSLSLRSRQALMSNVATLFQERPPLAVLVRRPDYRWMVIGTVCVGAFMGQLDASIANLVIPTLEHVLHQTVANVEWVAISYLLTLVALVTVFGRLADMVGRKMLYTTGFIIFTAGSLLCGLSTTLLLLITARILQAVGAAMLQANSVAIITYAAGPSHLGRAIGVQGAAQAIGLSVGPALGGFLITTLGWQWVFYINVPAGIIGILMAWFILPLTAKVEFAPSRQRFDWPGALLFTPMIVSLTLALTYTNTLGFGSPLLWGLIAGAIWLGVVFVGIERRDTQPLLDFALFARRTFTAGILSGLLSYTVLFGTIFLMPFFLERVLSLSPAGAGLILITIPVTLTFLAPLSGLLADKFGSRLLTAGGMLLATIALFAFALSLSGTAGKNTLLLTVGFLVFFGCGLGFFTPPNNAAIMGSAPIERLGVASGVLNMTRGLGTTLGVALTGVILLSRLSTYSGQHVYGTEFSQVHYLIPAFHDTLLFLAGLAFLTMLLALVRGREDKAQDVEHLGEKETLWVPMYEI